MTTSLKILTLATEEQSAGWLNLLEQAGFAVEAYRYDSLEALSILNEAKSRAWELALLSDSLVGLPGAAVSTFRAHFPHTPLIIIAGRPSLTAAVAFIKAGASGYLAENDLAALGETVREALAEASRADAAAALRRQEDAHYRQMFENNSAVKLLIEPTTGAVVDANEAACRFYGYERTELVKMNIKQINTLSHEEVNAEMAKAESEQRLYFEFRHRAAAGVIHDVEVRSSPLIIDGKRLLYSVIHDITERKQMEKAQGFMVTISHLLNSTLRYETVLKDVAKAAVPFLGDACLVFMLQPDGAVKLQALAALDEAEEACYSEWFERHPISPEDIPGIAGAPNKQAQIRAGLFGSSSPATVESDCYRAVGADSSLVVPLSSQDRVQGIIVFINGRSGRTFSEVDARLAEGLSRRIGLAIDNARHYEEARQAADAEIATRQKLENLAQLLAHQADELNAIIEAIPDGVFICDASGEVARLNPRAIDLLGLNDAEDPVASYKQIKVYYPDGRPVPREERPLVQALRGVTNTEFRELINHGITGQPIQARVSFAPIRNADGEIRGGVAIVSDITELHRLEKQKDEFLTIASHELKTPITSIKGLTQLAIRRLKRAGITNEVATLQSVEKQVDRMIELISDMLDTRRIQHGRLELQFRPFDLASLVRETSHALQATTTRHKISVEAPAEMTVTGDAHRLEQVLNNLLTNAIKYSPKGGPIRVRLAAQEGQAVVSVRDHGIGIPEKDRANLFQPFHRASNVSLYEVAGFGLGLYLCGEIIKAHQGRLWLEDEQAPGDPAEQVEETWSEQAVNSGVVVPVSGSIFCFSLPLDLPPDLES